jgi:hypothetical protein
VLEVKVENVESGRGEGGDHCVLIVAVETGLRVGTLSEAGRGRRRLRIDEATESGSAGTLETGSGGGGEAGGER